MRLRRSFKAFIASLAVVVALFVAAVPANAKSGNGRGSQKIGTTATTSTMNLDCASLGFEYGCYVIWLT